MKSRGKYFKYKLYWRCLPVSKTHVTANLHFSTWTMFTRYLVRDAREFGVLSGLSSWFAFGEWLAIACGQ